MLSRCSSNAWNSISVRVTNVLGQRKAMSSMRDLAGSVFLLHSSRDIYKTCISFTTCLCGQIVWGDQAKKRVLCAEWLLYFLYPLAAPSWQAFPMAFSCSLHSWWSLSCSGMLIIREIPGVTFSLLCSPTTLLQVTFILD